MKLWLKQHRVKDMKHRFPQAVLTVEAPGALESPHPWSPTQGVCDGPGQLCFLQGCQEFSGSGNGKPSYQIGDSWEGAFPPLDQTIIRWSLWFSSVSYRSIVGKYCITWVCHESLCEGAFSAPSILDHWINWEKSKGMGKIAPPYNPCSCNYPIKDLAYSWKQKKKKKKERKKEKSCA